MSVNTTVMYRFVSEPSVFSVINIFGVYPMYRNVSGRGSMRTLT